MSGEFEGWNCSLFLFFCVYLFGMTIDEILMMNCYGNLENSDTFIWRIKWEGLAFTPTVCLYSSYREVTNYQTIMLDFT